MKKRNKKYIKLFCWIIVGLIICLDQLTKYIALDKLVGSESLPLIKNIFHLTLVKNSGIAFGLFPNGTIIFIIFSFLAAGIILGILLKKKIPEILPDTALALILGGAAGNLIDRLRWGYVVDFFDFRIWPVFNIADSAISVGVVLLSFYILKKR